MIVGMQPEENTRKSTLFSLYVLGLLISFRYAIPSYVTSSYLSGIFGERFIGYIFAIGSVFGLLVFYFASHILRRWGNYKTSIIFSIISFLALFTVAIAKNPLLILICLTASSAAGSLVALNLDIFVEHDSANAKTGNIRGVFLATQNAAYLVSPYLAGLIIATLNYKGIFLSASLMMIPFILIIFSNLKGFPDPEYKEFHLKSTAKEFFRRRDIKFITISYFLLQFFFAWMVIYTPLYLHSYIGFDWLTIGKIFTIMLLPFVIIEAPLGRLADKKFGEKEILTIGFILMAAMTALMPLVVDKNFWIWALLLFGTRIGAAMVEVMCDAYFFKNIGDKDANLISIYRSMVPIAYIVAPITATIFLMYLPISYLFYILGFLMLFGLRYSLAIKDTL